ncbi:hypothetical protein [Olsenella sp. Marseille-QA0557]|uniref:CdiA C-terminal domain-containing protein n=1 Tax=Olsenella sp. Marseille-QA0557 TaxID=3378782 RepID=UPI003D0B0E8D
MGRGKDKGKIIIEPGVNVWPHELKTAEALAMAGYTVEFVRRSEQKRMHSADVLIDNELWEFKAPTSDKVSAVDKNVRKALHQAKHVVFDSRRMKKVSDIQIEHELRKSAQVLRSMRHLVFVNRHAEVIDIK